jgi:hypothetical protein
MCENILENCFGVENFIRLDIDYFLNGHRQLDKLTGREFHIKILTDTALIEMFLHFFSSFLP